MGKIKLFTFLEKKIDNAEYRVLIAKAMEKAVFRELAVHIAVTYIANALSKCEFRTYENGKEVKGETYYKLNIRPNPNENSSQFIQHFVKNYYYGDKGALIVNYEGAMYVADNFDVDESNPLKPYVYKNVTFGSTTLKRPFLRKDVVHLRCEDAKVKELVDKVGIEYGQVISLAMQSFKRTNGKKYKLLLDQYQAGDPNFKKTYEEVVQAQLKSFIESDGSAVYPKYDGIDLQEFSTETPTSSGDILAIRKEMFDVTAQGFRIPLPMMYGNITNMNEIVKVFLSFCVDPFADMVSEEFTGQTYGFEGWNRGNYVAVDTSHINHVDIFEVAPNVEKLISSGMCSIDDLRPYLNFNLLGTEFSRRHYMTKNFEPAENVLTQEGGEE
jgi:HK97 family phage portal protein